MRRTVGGLLLILALPILGHAQAAPVGRLSLLDRLSHQARCTPRKPTADLRRAGIVRILNIEEPGPRHLFSLGMAPRNTPRMLMVIASTRDGRRGEGESVTVFFGDTGVIVRGERSAFTTGTPAQRSDDRRLGLLPRDSAQVLELVRAIRRLCRA